MAVEEVGVKFTTEGEAQFYNALAKALDGVTTFDQALAKMSAQEKNSAAFDQFKAKLDGMTQAEKDAAIAAVQMSNETKGLGDTSGKASGEFTKSEHAMISFNLVMEAGKKIAQFAKQAYIELIGSTVEYGTQVTALSLITGANVEDTSRLIQTADDLKLGYDALSNMMEYRARKAMDTSIEGLGKLSDEYLKLAPGQERATFLMKEFGRSGSDIAEVMGKGSSAIRDISASQAANLIMTQKNIDAARDWERNLDDAGDAVQGLKYDIGNALIPQLNAAYTAYKQWYVIQGMFIDQLDQHNAVMKIAAKSYEEYITEMKRAAAAAGLEIDAEGNLVHAYTMHGAKIVEIKEKNFALSESIFIVGQKAAFTAGEYQLLKDQQNGAGVSADGLKYAEDRAALSLVDYASSAEGAAARTASLKAGVDALSKSYQSYLTTAMSIYSENKAYEKSYWDIQNSIVSLTAQVGILSKTTPFTPEQATTVNNYYTALQLAEKAVKSMLNTSSKDAPAALKTLNEAIAKLTGGPASFTSAGNAVKYLQDKVNELSAGHYLTEEQKKELADAQEELTKQKTALTALEEEHTRVTKQMILNMLIQKAASDGLTTVEFGNLMRIAKSWGLVDEATFNSAIVLNGLDLNDGNLKLTTFDQLLQNIATSSTGAAGAYATATDTMNGISLGVMRGELAPVDALQRGLASNAALAALATAQAAARMNEIKLGVARGELAPIDALLRSITAIPHDQTFNIHTKYTNDGQPPFSPTVAPPSPQIPTTTPKPYDPNNDPTTGSVASQLFNNTVRAIIGASAMASQAQSISNSNQSNYNLSVMTNQSPAVVQQSFEMMRLLA
jgi:hypothetical protein